MGNLHGNVINSYECRILLLAYFKVLIGTTQRLTKRAWKTEEGGRRKIKPTLRWRGSVKRPGNGGCGQQEAGEMKEFVMCPPPHQLMGRRLVQYPCLLQTKFFSQCLLNIE